MIVFDTETTGLPLAMTAPLTKQPEIIEFAGIKLDDETYEEIDRLEFLVKPVKPITPFITNITKITNEMVEDAKPFAGHVAELSNFFLGEKSMCAHNVAFDRNMLNIEMMRLGRVLNFPWPPNHICTVEKSYYIHNRRMKMGDLHEHATGEVFENAHRAMPDTEALVRCVRWLIEEKKKKG
jgi:DNA polymerase III alpha subunit (gram-positive type)